MGGGDAAGVTQRLPIALTIAGSDSGGGAGIQADLKTFAALGVYAASVVTALTAQNTRGVRAIHYPPPEIVGAQIEAVLEDFAVAAIKIGMLGSAEIANVVAERLSAQLASQAPHCGARRRQVHRLRSRYDRLLRRRAERRRLRRGDRHELLPLVDCLTPNLSEAAALLGEPIAQKRGRYGSAGRGVVEARPARGFDEGRTPRRRRGGGPFDDRGRGSPFRGAETRFPKPSRHRLHPLERHRRQHRSRGSLVGGCGGGQDLRPPIDRAWPGCHARRGSRAARSRPSWFRNSDAFDPYPR